VLLPWPKAIETGVSAGASFLAGDASAVLLVEPKTNNGVDEANGLDSEFVVKLNPSVAVPITPEFDWWAFLFPFSPTDLMLIEADFAPFEKCNALPAPFDTAAAALAAAGTLTTGFETGTVPKW
jgi:hypothetical protein